MRCNKETGMVGELDGAVVRLRPMSLEEKLGLALERVLLEWGRPVEPRRVVVSKRRGFVRAVRQVKVGAGVKEMLGQRK